VVLAATGTALVGSLAGCSSFGGESTPPAFHDGDWDAYGNGPANRNRVRGGAPEPADASLLASTNWPYAPPVVHDDTAYVASGERVVAVQANGVEAWQRPGESRVVVSGAPALDPDEGLLYVPKRTVPRVDGPDPAPAFLVAYDSETGFEQWRARVGDDRAYGVTVHDGDVYVRSATACVKLGSDGIERWRTPMAPLAYDEYSLDGDFATQVAPAVENTSVYVLDQNALVKLEPGTGDELWRVDANAPYAAPVLDDGGVVQTGWQGVVATDRYGDVRWRRDFQSLAAAAVDGTDVYVAARDLHELDGTTGETNWSTRLSSGELATAAPIVTDDSVVVDDNPPVAYRRDAGGPLGPERERWAATGTQTSAYASPVIASGRLFAVGPSGLYGFEPADEA
jgi:outer membrane protein assembly factor BamB